MSKIPSKEPEYAKNHFLRHIESRAAWFGLSSAEDLGDRVGVTGTTVRQYRKAPEKMQLQTLQEYIRKLKLDPLVVLRFLGYTQKDINKALRGEFAEADQ